MWRGVGRSDPRKLRGSGSTSAHHLTATPCTAPITNENQPMRTKEIRLMPKLLTEGDAYVQQVAALKNTAALMQTGSTRSER